MWTYNLMPGILPDHDKFYAELIYNLLPEMSIVNLLYSCIHVSF